MSNDTTTVYQKDIRTMKERRINSLPGGLALLGILISIGIGVAIVASQLPVRPTSPDAGTRIAIAAVGGSVFGLLAIIILMGMVTVGPNEALVLQLFGRYTGTVKDEGLRWVNPFTTKWQCAASSCVIPWGALTSVTRL